MQLSRRAAVWLIPSFLALHDAEEALTLRQALPRVRDTLPSSLAALAARVTYPTIVVLLAALPVAAFGLALLAASRPDSRGPLWMLLSLEVAVGLNAIWHVASAALVFQGYSPGLVTAVLLNGPFAVVCMRRANQEHWLSPSYLRATLPTAVVLHGPVLLGGLWLVGRLSG